jgi:hypothetical protein
MLSNFYEYLQAAILGLVGGTQAAVISNLVSDQDWSRIKGTEGALFLAVVQFAYTY